MRLQAGVTDGVHVVLYGDSPMTTGLVAMSIAPVGHETDVSMLDGGSDSWRSAGRQVSATAAPAVTGKLSASLMYWAAKSVRPAGAYLRRLVAGVVAERREPGRSLNSQ